ncbi:hypothetical protein [Ferrimonas balearica]|uniref:hypothetical protein n=1 Tax=Ferrimonas balearica TaxID=44012 RepID=UPI001C99A086|nr:hypothetical protein [Ferrimonas balearica]MBY5994160.1 hypothetical protein [Ferrimonas balearica]
MSNAVRGLSGRTVIMVRIICAVVACNLLFGILEALWSGEVYRSGELISISQTFPFYAYLFKRTMMVAALIFFPFFALQRGNAEKGQPKAD